MEAAGGKYTSGNGHIQIKTYPHTSYAYLIRMLHMQYMDGRKILNIHPVMP